MVKNILFVCTGNTCRSAMAVFVARDLAAKNYAEAHLKFDSAGLMALENSSASQGALGAMAQENIDMSGHRAKRFQEYMVNQSHLIVTMTTPQKNMLLAAYPQAAAKTFTLGEMSGSGLDVDDPYLGSAAIYAATAELLKKEISLLLAKVVSEEK